MPRLCWSCSTALAWCRTQNVQVAGASDIHGFGRRWLSGQAKAVRRPAKLQLSPKVGTENGLLPTALLTGTAKLGKDVKTRKGDGHQGLPLRPEMMEKFDYSRRMKVKKTTRNLDTFEKLGVRQTIIGAMKADLLPHLDYVNPSQVQSLVVPELLQNGKKAERVDTLFAAETGSGKTLAYLMPIMHLLKVAEEGGLECHAERASERNHPVCVILVPSAELVVQTSGVAKKLSYEAKLRVSKISPSDSRSDVNRVMQSSRDIVVSTPAQLERYVSEHPGSLTSLRFLVVDEADTLLDESFSPTVSKIIRSSENLRQLILCSATIPRALDGYIRRELPQAKYVVTSKVHTISRKTGFEVIDAKKDHNGNKKLALLNVISRISSGLGPEGGHNVIVFVNERDAVLPLTNYLVEKGVNAVGLSKNSERREEILESFSRPDKATKGVDVLVTTDIASRGIDTMNVKDVVVFDVPHSAIDLLHRVGRTGRFNKRGRAFLIINKERNIRPWVKLLKQSVRTGQPLH